MIEIEKWQDWSPIIKHSSGKPEVGSQLNITMMGKEKGQDGPTYCPKITELNPARSLRWRAHMLASFLFTNDKLIELEESAGGTKLIHSEIFSGLLAKLFCSQMEKGVPPMLESMNKALKQKVES